MLPKAWDNSVSKSKPSEAYLKTLKQRYHQATKKERSAILNEFVKTTGYHRKHAIALLGGKRRHRTGAIRRPRGQIYTAEDRRAVRQLAEWFDYIGSKRLRVAMNTTLPDLRRQGHLRVSQESYDRLLKISPATMDRVRAANPEPGRGRRGLTKPGRLLKSQIPIRTFADWDNKRPGFVEVDLVDHSGGNASGEFAQTLTATDVLTGWTEVRAVRTKAQKFVFAALQVIRGRLPTPLLGIDSDNGAEFINDQLRRYCEGEKITFTRGRVGRKNDNAFVEQKNWSVVRRIIGYDRYHSQRQVDQLNRLYDQWRLYVNFFLPVMKLVKKERVGSRVKKVYDEPQTPYARILASPDVSEADKAKLRALYAKLDVVILKQAIDDLLEALTPSRAG